MSRDHWEAAHAAKQDRVSWHQDRPTLALAFIRACGLPPGAAALDAGSGASRMAEALLELGLRPTLADLAQEPLERVKARLGERAREVRFMQGDLRALDWPAGAFDLWHDRAVFHFLTDPADRAAYVARMHAALRPGGFLVMACFAPEGPERCSGLTVRRYDAEGLAAELGPGFELLEAGAEIHPTPFGTTQAFTLARFRRI